MVRSTYLAMLSDGVIIVTVGLALTAETTPANKFAASARHYIAFKPLGLSISPFKRTHLRRPTSARHNVQTPQSQNATLQNPESADSLDARATRQRRIPFAAQSPGQQPPRSSWLHALRTTERLTGLKCYTSPRINSMIYGQWLDENRRKDEAYEQTSMWGKDPECTRQAPWHDGRSLYSGNCSESRYDDR